MYRDLAYNLGSLLQFLVIANQQLSSFVITVNTRQSSDSSHLNLGNKTSTVSTFPKIVRLFLMFLKCKLVKGRRSTHLAPMCMKTERNNNCQLTIFLPDFLVSLFHLCLPVRTEHFLMSHTFSDNIFFTPFKHSPESHDHKPVWAGSSLKWAFLPPHLRCFCVTLWRKLIWSWATMQQGQIVALSGQVNREIKLQIETKTTWAVRTC